MTLTFLLVTLLPFLVFLKDQSFCITLNAVLVLLCSMAVKTGGTILL